MRREVEVSSVGTLWLEGRSGRVCGTLERVGLADVAAIVRTLVLVLSCGSDRRSAECAVRLVYEHACV